MDRDNMIMTTYDIEHEKHLNNPMQDGKPLGWPANLKIR